jgi:hypothetical protein
LTCPPTNLNIDPVMNTTTEYKTHDEAWEAGNAWVRDTDRFEKLDFLMETASPEFKDNLVNELVKFMGQDDFNEFFNHLRRNWGINTPQELEYEMNQ